MNLDLITAFLRQRLTSPVRMVLLFIAFSFPLIPFAFVPHAPLSLLGANTANIALIFAAGVIGQDFSAGVLQLLFARPIKRSEYVFSRWAASAGFAAALVIVQILIGGWLLKMRDAAPTGSELGIFIGENALLAIGVASVITLFSALMPGLGDLALYVIANVLRGVFSIVSQFLKPSVVYARIGDEIERFISPRIDLAAPFALHAMPWFSVISYVSTITLCLALAILIVNRRELSYASG